MAIIISTDNPSTKDICQKYWTKNEFNKFVIPIKTLLLEYQINSKELLNIIKNNSVYELESVKCKCGTIYQCHSRADYMETYKKSMFTCDKCAEEHRKEYFPSIEEIRDRIRILNANKKLKKSISQFDLCLLDYEEKVALLTLIRYGATSDYERILPISEWDTSFTPAIDYEIKLLSNLYKKECIYISDKTDFNNYFRETDIFKANNYRKYSWEITTNSIQETQNELEEYFNTNSFCKEFQILNLSLWKHIALNEIRSYLFYQAKQSNLNLKISSKLEDNINYGLQFFSIGEMNSIIRSTIRNLNDWRIKESPPIYITQNALPNKIKRYIDSAMANKWKLFNDPIMVKYRSAITELFFNFVIKVGDSGYTSKLILVDS